LQSAVYDEIKATAARIKETDGVVGVVLYGSYARGDYDEGSDIDLLVVFKNKEKMGKGLMNIYQITAESNQFFQAAALTLDELKESPLRRSALRDGKIYYANSEVEKLSTKIHKPYALVTYSTANLNRKEKVFFVQKLEGRGKGKYRYDGLVQRLGGYKVGRGVAMIPVENSKVFMEHLEEKGVKYVIRYVWA